MALIRPRSAPSMRIAAGVILLFAIIAWQQGASVAAIVISCYLAAYATEFYLFRCAAALLHRQATPWTMAVALSALAADVTLVYCGFGILLALGLGVFLLIDGILLRFK